MSATALDPEAATVSDSDIVAGLIRAGVPIKMRRPSVRKILGDISDAMLDRMIAEKAFPRPEKEGRKFAYWWSNDVIAYLNARRAASVRRGK